MTNFTHNLLKAGAVAALAFGACFTAQAQDKLYLSDVYTVEDLNSDIFGVPQRCDNAGDGKFVARYYNQTPNNAVYFLASKTDFSEVYGLMDGELGMGSSLDEVDPIILPEAGKYYEITIDINDMAYEAKTYEVADYMDPLFWELGSENLNVWFNFVDNGDEDSWEHIEGGSWVRTLYFGYTCSEYMKNENGEYVTADGATSWMDPATGDEEPVYDKEAGIDHRAFVRTVNPLGEEVDAEQLRWCQPWTVDANNPHLYVWDDAKHYFEGEKLNFIIHNWHEAGWWNYITWRVEDETECDIFSYYGGVVKQAYLDWAFPGKDANWKQWRDDEGYRRQVIYDGGNDAWCKPVVPATGDYKLIFDTHIGRAKLVNADKAPAGIETLKPANADGPAVYYNLQGVRVDNPTSGIYIKRQGSASTKVLIR